MIVDEDVYLEHFGKKGMRWGVRNEISKKDKVFYGESKQKYKNRSTKQKFAIVSIAAGSAFVASRFIGRRTLSLPLSVISGLGAGYVGIRATERLLDKKGNTPISKLSK